MAVYATKRTPDQRDFLGLSVTTAADGLSNVGDLGGLRLAGIEMSTAWTAADLAFLGSPESSASMKEIWRVADSTAPAAYTVSTTANRIIGFNSQAFDGIRFIQLASVATGSTAALAQAAARSVRLLLGVPSGPIK